MPRKGTVMKKKSILRFCAGVLALTATMNTAAFAAEKETAFGDVKESDYFYDAVNWGAEAGITYGTEDGIFSPDGEVTRAQVTTFLWRMAGQPAPTNAETFSDVEAGSWYETAVQWAVENGITAGTGDGLFSPDMTCNRAMCITLLYRYMNSPLDEAAAAEPVEIVDDASMEDMTMEQFGIYFVQSIIKSFREMGATKDVPEGAYYELPVIWAIFSGVITEHNVDVYDNSMFVRPEEPCVRREMISFLYQAKLLEDMENEPQVYEIGPIALPIPQEYFDLLAFEVYGISDDDDEDFVEETVIVVSELASKEAAEKLGEMDTDGIGELFRIIRVSDARLHELLCGDMSGLQVFAKDESGKYFIICYPTDVRYMRESNEQMNEDIEQWTALNSWARDGLTDAILESGNDLTPVSYTNTLLDMYIARAAFADDVEYKISAEEYGPLKTSDADVAIYADYLLSGGFEEVEDASVPEGGSIVLTFPEDGVRYEFFEADENLVREVRDDYVTMYRRVLPGNISNTEAVRSWYYKVAEEQGKKKVDSELDAYIGEWREEFAGRGVMTVKRSVGVDKVDVAVRWPGSAFDAGIWSITARLAANGSLVYDNGIYAVVEYDEEGNGTIAFQSDDESGNISVNKSGRLIWSIDGEEGENTFVRDDQ